MLIRISTETVCQPNQRGCAEYLQALLWNSIQRFTATLRLLKLEHLVNLRELVGRRAVLGEGELRGNLVKPTSKRSEVTYQLLNLRLRKIRNVVCRVIRKIQCIRLHTILRRSIAFHRHTSSHLLASEEVLAAFIMLVVAMAHIPPALAAKLFLEVPVATSFTVVGARVDVSGTDDRGKEHGCPAILALAAAASVGGYAGAGGTR
jgi:hypothetical protein